MSTRLALVGLAFVLVLSCQRDSEAVTPVARDGRIDLQKADLLHTRVELKGEWRYSPGQFLPPDSEGASPLLQPAPAPAPTGTLTLRVAVPMGSPPLAVRTPLIGTAFELWAQGRLLASEGAVALTAQAYTPRYRPRIIELPPPDAAGEIFLSLRFANFQDLHSGAYYPIEIGEKTLIAQVREQAVAWEAVVFGALFFMGVYHFGFFLFRSRNRSPLWFGLFCLLVALRSTLYSELLFLNAFPDTPWEFILKAVYLGTVLPVGFFMLFISDLYPSLKHELLTRIAFGVPLAYSLLIILTPPTLFTQGLLPFQIFMITVGGYGVVQLVRAFAKGLPGARLFLVGMAIFLTTVILDILKANIQIPLPSLVAWGTLVFILLQGFVITRQFSLAFQQVEEYSNHLASLNTSLERFIPKEVLGFLDKKSILQIGLGDYTEQRMSVFFLDIRDFTALSETMTPEQNFRFINNFLKQFGPIIRQNNGFVDKYLGDGIMALFPGQPDDAVNAALAMRLALPAYNQNRAKAGYQPIRFGIGIHTGPLMLGTIGENLRMDSTVISDTVNVASRLEGLTKKFEVDILISGDTYRSLRADHQREYRFFGNETVKGKSQAVEVYHVKN